MQVWEAQKLTDPDLALDPEHGFVLFSLLDLWSDLGRLLSYCYPFHPEIYRDYPRPPSLEFCARNILTVLRETLKQYITFNRGGERGVCTLVLCSLATVLSCINPL
jgi:hypothetical protein